MVDPHSSLAKLECSKCGKSYEYNQVIGTCPCGYPLLARYDLEKAKESLKKDALAHRESSLWRYRELLPVIEERNIVSLGEGLTPIVKTPNLGNEVGIDKLMIKDEGIIPTGTFKARGAAVGVSKCKELGIKRISMPTNGNAGAAWSTYAARAGIDTYIVMPMDAPDITRAECYEAGAHLYLINGLINDAGAVVKKAAERYNFFDVSTLKEPYRLEGKKTMGMEIVEQLGWKQPDVIAYPTGGGVGLIGIHKALLEMKSMGLIDDITTRLVSVQAEGCSPIVKAFDSKKEESNFFENSQTIAFGINVPKALGDFLVLRALYETGGTAVSVTDEDILRYQKLTASREGLFMCPEGAATVAGLQKLREDGWIDPDETVLALNTGSGIKYPNTVSVDAPLLQKGDEITLTD